MTESSKPSFILNVSNEQGTTELILTGEDKAEQAWDFLRADREDRKRASRYAKQDKLILATLRRMDTGEVIRKVVT